MRKELLRSIFREEAGRRPLRIAFANEHSSCLRSAADVQLPFITGEGIKRAIVAGLAAILPLRATQITVDATRIVVAARDASPIVGACRGIQVAVVDDERADAGRSAVTDAAAVDPLLTPFITIDMAPIRFVLALGRARVKMTLVHRHRVADIVAGGIRVTAILPIGHPRVVDSKMNMAIGALRLISARTGIDRKRNSSPLHRIVLIDHVADDVVEFLLRVNPSTNRKIPFPSLSESLLGISIYACAPSNPPRSRSTP